MSISNQIAILATGDEIVTGDILNTNAQQIAKALHDQHLPLGYQMVTSDAQEAIETAIRFLLKRHKIIITIGGLGPTSDDRTRFGLSDAIEVPLVFDVASWERLTDRLTKLGYDVPRTNRYQCLFPEGAKIIENPHGTANACRITLDEQTLFMLPGPPSECLPLFNGVVLPWLLKQGFATEHYRQSWLLMGIGEGDLAAKIQQLCELSPCDVGYRVDYPYLELKLSSADQKAFDQLKQAIYPHINKYIISETRQTASSALKTYVTESQHKIRINDQSTRGHLASAIMTPKTAEWIEFTDREDDSYIIQGLENYWSCTDVATFRVKITKDGNTQTLLIPNRGEKSLLYAVEILAFELLKTMT